MNEETLSLIWSRRSIRDFERREIEKETVDKLKARVVESFFSRKAGHRNIAQKNAEGLH